MATRSLGRYDHPNFLVRREAHQKTVAGNGAVKTFRHYQKMRLKALHSIVVTAGTSDSPGNALTIKHGTTSIGAVALGTATAGVTFTNTFNLDVDSLALLSVTNGTDASGVADIIWEFEVLPDSALTV
ncbi:MAG: hypothetical protein AB7I50_23340 [Vicinamibacterales bacterium]